MKSMEEVIKDYKSPQFCIDGRDVIRLAKFIPEEKLKDIGVELLPECVGKHVAISWTRENILEQVKKDVKFGFEKALNKRGISSSLMNDVMKMWAYVFSDEFIFENIDNYSMYGLPLLKEMAIKFGFENPIGEDTGSEDIYNEQEW
jgi:hypothetical protein